MWKTLKAFGFIYYEAYITASGQAVAWISRTNMTARYSVFYCDGTNLVSGTRGSMINARAFAMSSIRSYAPSAVVQTVS